MIQQPSLMLPIRGVVKNYLWGSYTTLAAHRGESESSEPEAELWFGDSPHGPAVVLDSDITLDQVTETFGQLPFLAKILAVEQALSLQVHPALNDLPSLAEVKRDENHKPEMIVALTEFEALVGFASKSEIVELVDHLNSTQVVRLVAEPLRAGKSLTDILDRILGIEDTSNILEEVLIHSVNLDSHRQKWLRELINLYAPKLDPLALLLCNLVRLSPGESLYLPPRCIHAYLRGTVIEAMANSDNVIRGGLTHKPIDKRNFLALVDESNQLAQSITPASKAGMRYWQPPIADFSLTEFHGVIKNRIQVAEPAIVFAWKGNATITSPHTASAQVAVKADCGAFLTPGEYQVDGEGSIWVVTGKGR